MQLVNFDKLPSQAKLELLDFYAFLLEKYAPDNGTQPRLGELAIRLFGATNGIELELLQHPPHEPLKLKQ